MLVSRRADTDQRDAIPLSLLAVRRSLRSFRRFLLVGAIGFVAIPLGLFAVLQGTPLQFLPLALTIAGLFAQDRACHSSASCAGRVQARSDRGRARADPARPP
jgi:hypothetical protein